MRVKCSISDANLANIARLINYQTLL